MSFDSSRPYTRCIMLCLLVSYHCLVLTRNPSSASEGRQGGRVNAKERGKNYPPRCGAPRLRPPHPSGPRVPGAPENLFRSNHFKSPVQALAKGARLDWAGLPGTPVCAPRRPPLRRLRGRGALRPVLAAPCGVSRLTDAAPARPGDVPLRLSARWRGRRALPPVAVRP